MGQQQFYPSSASSTKCHPPVPKAQAGEFGDRLVGSVLRLLLDAGFLFLLRFSLDDRVDSVIAAAARALRALLVAPGDEVCQGQEWVQRLQGSLCSALGVPFAKALQAEWRIGWQVSATVKGHSPGASAPCCSVLGKMICSAQNHFFFLSLPTSPLLWQELLDSTFSWYHGASVFPMMPSHDDKADEDEDEELTKEKVNRKTPEEGSRPPPDLARHDVIKVEGTLHSCLDLQV